MKGTLARKYTSIPPCSIGILMGNKNVENLLRKWLEKDASLVIYNGQNDVTVEGLSKHHVFLVEDKCDTIDVDGIIELVCKLPTECPTKVIVFIPLAFQSERMKYEYA